MILGQIFMTLFKTTGIQFLSDRILDKENYLKKFTVNLTKKKLNRKFTSFLCQDISLMYFDLRKEIRYNTKENLLSYYKNKRQLHLHGDCNFLQIISRR